MSAGPTWEGIANAVRMLMTPQKDPRCVQCGFGSFPGHHLIASVRFCDGACKAAASAGLRSVIA